MAMLRRRRDIHGASLLPGTCGLALIGLLLSTDVEASFTRSMHER